MQAKFISYHVVFTVDGFVVVVVVVVERPNNNQLENKQLFFIAINSIQNISNNCLIVGKIVVRREDDHPQVKQMQMVAEGDEEEKLW